MLARIRLALPDRPGTLGAVATAIGGAGGDIVRVDVLESGSGRALDDLLVQIRDGDQLARVLRYLAVVPGVSVAGSQVPAPPSTGHADLELLGQVMARPERGLQTLVDGAPGALGADWAAAVEYGSDEVTRTVLAVSPGCPAPEQVEFSAPGQWTPRGAATVIPGTGATARFPVGPRTLLVLVRDGGLAFHDSELWRFGQLGELAVGVLGGRREPVTG